MPSRAYERLLSTVMFAALCAAPAPMQADTGTVVPASSVAQSVDPADRTFSDSAEAPESDAWAWQRPDVDVEARTLTIHALAGPEFRSRGDWRESIARRVELASERFEADFAVRLELKRIEPWNAVNERGDLAAAYQALWMTQAGDGADLVVAFLYTGHLSSAGRERADAENLGRASPFGRHIVLRDTEGVSTKMKIHTFIHELAHAFGAVHVGDERSLMHRYVSEEYGERFDFLSGERLWAAREFDFRAGITALDAEIAKEVSLLYERRHLPGEENPLVLAWQNEGVQRTAARDFDAALAAYDRTLELDPEKAGAHVNRGLVLRELGRLEEAEAALRQALACDDRVRGAAINLAETLLRLGRVDDAVVELEREIKRRPREAAAWHLLGVARVAAGNVDGAVDAYVEAVICDGATALRPILVPADEPVRRQLYEDAAARARADAEDGEAQIRLGLLLRLREERHAGLKQIARGLELLGEMESAARICTDLLAEKPHDRDLLHLSARLTLAAKRYDDAIRLFSDLLKQDRRDAAAYRGLGDAYKGKGMPATALKYYRQAEEVGRD